MNFFIKKDSTLPELVFPLTQKIREKYQITDDMLENVAVTFSMIDATTGLFKIANTPANIKYIKEKEYLPNEITYQLIYKFKLNETSRPGRYLGEFVIDFLNSEYGCGKIKLPIDDYINILISDSITKTTLI